MRLIFIYFFLLLFGCSKPPGRYGVEHYDVIRSLYPITDSCQGKTFVWDQFDIKKLSWGKRPYADTVTFLPNQPYVDDVGITMHKYTDRLSYHPVAMCFRSLALIDLYVRNGREQDLNLACAHADKLIAMGYEIDFCLLFPYNYAYNLYDRDHMAAPWFSAMAQGQALSVFSRLYEITEKSEFKEAADKVYRSLYRMKGQHEPWVSCIDADGNFWMEEYPHERPSHVLNGMIWAIYGVYDYYQIEPKQEVKRLFQASCNTILKHGDSFRDPKAYSFYCMKYDVKNPSYHRVHIEQLEMLYRLTGDNRFADLAIRFKNDV